MPAKLKRLLLAASAVLTLASAPAFADDRADARTHYMAGQKAYAASDYKAAIKEFTAAQQLVPADLNSYNLALCYDKLGDADSAIASYREYLNKQPNTEKRAEIEASIARLDAAAKSAATKREDEHKAEEAQRAADEQRKLDEQQRIADQQHKPAIVPPAPPAPAVGPTTATPPIGGPQPGGGDLGTPANPTVIPTGDAQLDRVNAIDINQIRAQRISMGMRIDNGAGSSAGGGAMQGPGVAASANATATGPNASGQGASAMAGSPSGAPLPNDKPQTEAPVYKKWWFWAVVGVGAYVAYEVATNNSQNPNKAQPAIRNVEREVPHGLTLLRW